MSSSNLTRPASGPSLLLPRTPSGSGVRQLLWKEYRQQRALWLAVAAIALGIQGLFVYAAELSGQPVGIGIFFCAFGFPSLYALGCGAMMFAGEQDAQTHQLLQALPVRGEALGWSKLAFGAASTLLMFPCLVLAAAAMVRLHDGPVSLPLFPLSPWLGSLLAALELFAWSAFFSLRVKHPLWAILLATATAVFFGFLLLPPLAVYTLVGHGVPLGDAYLASLPLRGLLALVIIGLDIHQAPRWLLERSTLRGPRRPPFPDLEQSAFRVAKRGALGRLIWQAYRQARWVMAAVISGLVLLALSGYLFVFFVNRTPPFLSILFYQLPFLAGWFGASVFQADQSRQSFRYFVEHGISGRQVWLSRQIVWGGAVLAWSLLMLPFGLLEASHRGATGTGTAEPLLLNLGATLLAYTAAQLGSVFTRSPIISLFLGLLGAILSILWASLMLTAKVPLWFSVAPLPVLFLAISWYRVPDWLLERTDWPARGKSLAAFSPLLLLLATVVTFRAYEIPAMGLPAEVAQPAPVVSAAARRTGEMYDEALRLYERSQPVEPPEAGGMAGMGMPGMGGGEMPGMGLPETDPSGTEIPGMGMAAAPNAERGVADPGPTAEQRAAWRAEAERLFLEASRRTVEGPLWDRRHDAEVQRLASAMLTHARELFEQGQPQAARELILAHFRFVRQVSYSSHWLTLSSIEPGAAEALVAWVADSGASAEQIRELREQVAATSYDVVEVHRREILATARELRSVLERNASGSPWAGPLQIERERYHRLATWAPWEAQRVRRLIDYGIAQQLAYLNQARSIQSGMPIYQLPSVRTAPAAEALASWSQSTLLGDAVDFSVALRLADIYSVEERRRALQISLGLQAYRADQGAFPETLESLVEEDRYLDKLPADPFSGTPFLWLPRGFPLGIAPADHLSHSQPLTPANTPFLWSSGSEVVIGFRGLVPGAEDIYRSYLHRPSASLGWPERGGEPYTTLIELLHHGRRYEVK